MQNQPRPVIKLACPYPECSGENPSQARFCATCGRALRISDAEGPETRSMRESGGGGGALVWFSITAFVLFVLFSAGGVWRHSPVLMFLPIAIFAIGVGKERRRRRWRHWD